MNNATGVESMVENYLVQVRTALRGLPDREIGDILRELRSHVVELGGEDGAGVEAALRSLGDPVDLAKRYRAESQIVQGECSGSPLAILLGLRHAARSRIGRIAVTALYLFGYANVVSLWVAAIDKLFFPAQVGFWYTAGSTWPLALVTDGRAPAGAKELLGWWLGAGRRRCGVDFAVCSRPGGSMVAAPVPPIESASDGLKRDH
ncbi:MAG TPA: hypothetical protein VGV35_14260 [Bryobacteraceae bacterium]|nr:hypothetical protein [Bryobacteraceae bacterium]